MLFPGWEKCSFSSVRIRSVGKEATINTSNNMKHGKTIASPSLVFLMWEKHFFFSQPGKSALNWQCLGASRAFLAP